MILFDDISLCINLLNFAELFKFCSLDKSGQINEPWCLSQIKYSDIQRIPLKQTNLIKHTSLNFFQTFEPQISVVLRYSFVLVNLYGHTNIKPKFFRTRLVKGP